MEAAFPSSNAPPQTHHTIVLKWKPKHWI